MKGTFEVDDIFEIAGRGAAELAAILAGATELSFSDEATGGSFQCRRVE